MMCLWESGEQGATLYSSARGKSRVLDRLAIRCLPKKKIWISLLEGKKIWVDRKMAAAWEVPFSARWRMNVIKDSILSKSRVYSRASAAAIKDDKFVVYPLERDRTTPLTVFCMRDVMKNTLGVGPCEYIIATEGLANASTPHEVTAWMLKQVKRKRGRRKLDEIRKRFARMIEHVKHSQQRVNAYRDFSKAMMSACQRFERSNPALSETTRELKDVLKRIGDGVESREEDLRASNYGEALARRIVAVIGEDNDKIYDACRELSEKVRAIGTAQDRSLAKCRLAVRWLDSLCEMSKGREPKADKLLAEMRRSIKRVLKGHLRR